MRCCLSLLFVVLACYAQVSSAHDLSGSNAAYVESLSGPAVGAFLYLGAKHMFTGYDHLLFLFGVIFFLYRSRDIILYVTLFTLGHSITLMLGVWQNWTVSSHLVDAIIGLSIVYKAFENIGGFRSMFGFEPDTRIAVFVFGLCHGLGLATKLQEYISRETGLVTNLLSFNVGVELGQIAALMVLLALLIAWRRLPAFESSAYLANLAIMTGGFTLAGYQAVGYWLA